MSDYDGDQDYTSTGQPDPKPGPFLAKVISHQDATYMGVLEVEILHPAGGDASEGQLHQVKYMSPFFGQTSVDHIGQDPDDYNNTQKSYGMWMIPPDPGTIVVVIFIDGDPKRGYWMGCVPDESTNFMVPGIASTQRVVEDVDPDLNNNYGRVPVAEYNKITPGNAFCPADPTQNLKPRHPLAAVLEQQGLLFDSTRGITTSSARRETPSMVFGISTPGPIDKQDGAKQGQQGKAESRIENAFVSRLGGTTFVMDDGDDKYLRKTTASEGPPEYAAVEQDELDGKPTLLHNELFRIRTRTGHQILFHNTEDLIYISNARGTAWIELTSDGKIDIYAKDSISVRTENDFNFYAGRDINMEAGRNFNLKVAERHQTEIGKDKILIVTANNKIEVKGTHDETITGATKITAKAGFDLNTTGANKFTSSGNANIKAANTTISGGDINFNGPTADAAAAATVPVPLTTFLNSTEETGTTIESIMLRTPTTEPYPHHENLNPTDFKVEKTDREIGSAIAVSDYWKVYTTTTDTFKKFRI